LEDDKDIGFRPAAEPEPASAPGPSLGAILGFEFGLGALAIVLALIFGLRPWLDLHFGPAALLWSVLATLPLLAGLWLTEGARARWVLELKDFMRRVVVPWFARMRWWGLALVALSAGIGEELLFRGVIQAGLTGPLGPLPALLIASLLFGLVHAMSRAYFLITFLAGIYLGLLYLWSGNLLIPIIVHFLYDWAALQYYVSRYGGKINTETTEDTESTEGR
jgi:uncharacterized protein